MSQNFSNTKSDDLPHILPQLSKKAQDRVYELINDLLLADDKKDQQNLNINDYFLRLSVLGGGCAGFKYDFLIDSSLNEDDKKIPCGQVSLVVDKVSLSFLTGATVDYKEELIGSNFIVSNPLADSACGCGTSFNLKAS